MAFPLIPLVILGLGLGLAACTKAVTTAKVDRPLYDLAGSEWGFKGGSDKAPERFVQFRAKGELSGSGGCNNFFGTYDLNGTALKIGPLASTKKMCAGGMEDERAFLGALQSARRIEATHMALNIFGENGELLLGLQRRDWD